MRDREKDEVLTAEEAAEYLRMALSTLYRYMRSGQVPCFKVGNQWRFKRSVLDEWIERISTTGSSLNSGKETEMLGLDLGLGGIFKGIGSLLELAAELAEKEPTEVHREGHVGPTGEKGFNAVYGFSVRVGGGGKPTVQHFGNVREAAKGPVVDDVREPMVDTFDEGEFIRVIAEMPGVDGTDIKYDLKEDVLIISGEKGDRKYYKELLLPSAIDAQKTTHSSNNGILEMKLWKVKQQ